jgi:L-fuconolactonase
VNLADAHVHLFAAGYAGTAGGPPAGADELGAYERLRARYGIERALVIGYEGEGRYLGNNDYVLGLAAERPWITPLVYVPAAPPPTPEALREIRARGAAGFAIYAPGELEARALARWPAGVKDELRRQRAVISFNAGLVAIAALAGFADELDGCPLLFSHLGLPRRRRHVATLDQAKVELAPLLALAANPRVVVKFSAPYAVSEPPHEFPHPAAAPIVEILLDSFGPERLLWGSDFSPALDFVSFVQTLDTRLLTHCTTAETEAVMGGNLLRLLEN